MYKNRVPLYNDSNRLSQKFRLFRRGVHFYMSVGSIPSLSAEVLQILKTEIPYIQTTPYVL